MVNCKTRSHLEKLLVDYRFVRQLYCTSDRMGTTGKQTINPHTQFTHWGQSKWRVVWRDKSTSFGFLQFHKKFLGNVTYKSY